MALGRKLLLIRMILLCSSYTPRNIYSGHYGNIFILLLRLYDYLEQHHNPCNNTGLTDFDEHRKLLQILL